MREETRCLNSFPSFSLTFHRHGRDHKLIVWKVAEDDEHRLSTTLPLEETPVPRPTPWMLHLLEVNTMNFCAFGAAAAISDSPVSRLDEASEILIAVPNTIASEQVIMPSPSTQCTTADYFRLIYMNYHPRNAYTPLNPAKIMAWP